DQTEIRRLIASGRDGNWQSVLVGMKVGYILVAHELDWQGYDYLNVAPGIALVGDYGTIDLYQVLAPNVSRQSLSTPCNTYRTSYLTTSKAAPKLAAPVG